jgi:UDP-glucose 4-epimerase
MSSGGRRILLTEVGSDLGSLLAQRLELDPGVETIVAVDSAPPRRPLGRTEFVRAQPDPARLAPILRAARIDTVIDIGLVSQLRSGWVRPQAADTSPPMLAAQHVPEVRKLVFASSAHGYGFGPAPAFFSEEMPCSMPSEPGLQRQVLEAEERVRRLAGRDRGRSLTILRLAEDIGPDSAGPHMGLLGLPAIPSILGFDPRWQLVEQHDVAGAVVHAVVAGDGVLALSELASLLGKPLLPILPPIGTDRALAALRRLGLPAPVELVRALRFGRGLDNRRLKSTGYAYRFTSREAVIRMRDRQQEPELVQGTLQQGSAGAAAPVSHPARPLP